MRGRKAALWFVGVTVAVLFVAGVGQAQETYGFQSVSDMAFVGDVAFVPDSQNQSVVALDMTDPTDPFAISVLEDPCSPGNPNHLDVDGDFAYIGMGSDDKLCIVDISDPASMEEEGSVSNALLELVTPVRVQGDFVYACGGGDTDDLTKVNVTDRTDPQVVDAVTDSDFTNCSGLDGKGDFLFTAQNTAGSDFRISNGTPGGGSMTLEGAVSACHSAMVADPDRDFAYCTHRPNNRLEVVDVSNVGSPTLTATLSLGEDVANLGYDPSTETVYVMGRNSNEDFHSIDVSTPTSPIFLDSIPKPNSDGENAHVIQVFSDHAYAPARTNGFNIFNVTDPSNLQHVTLVNEVLVAPGPTVNITNPLEGSTHLTNATVNVTANLTEGTDPINSVILDTNGDGVFNITANMTETSPGVFEVFGDWNVGTDAGSRDIVVQAFDTESRSGGDVVGVNVNTLNVSFVNPVENDTLTQGSVINVTGRVEEVGAGFNTSQAVPFDSGGDAGTFELNITEVSAGVFEVWGDWKVGDPVGERSISFAATDTLGGLNSAATTVTIQEAEDPTVTITNPAEASEHTQGFTVNVTANISEGDFGLDPGTVVLDTNGDGTFLMNTSDQGGGEWIAWADWKVGDPAGSRDLVVQASDTEGNSGGDTVSVTVVEADDPTVTITNPAEASEHTQGFTVNVTVDISEGTFELDPSTVVLDTNGDGTLLMNTSDQGGGEWIAWADWNVGSPDGQRDLAVVASDTEGNSGGDVVTVTVLEAEPPSVTITNPVGGADVVSGRTVRVEATVEAGTHPIDLGQIVLDTNGDGTFLMNVQQVSEGVFEVWHMWEVGTDLGSRNLVVQAFDTEGNSGADIVTVNVVEEQGIFGDLFINMIAEGLGLTLVSTKVFLAGSLIMLLALLGLDVAGFGGGFVAAMGGLVVSLGIGFIPTWVLIGLVLMAAALIAVRW